ncbi:MFS transporter [Paucibacter sp. XJ19-41]|uniref:MFS transporter n=1 Tax=Paucibacter sp. XJ19-41 TaxID=2927824 RepID=UPI002349D75F|nr:MFS transporter [Paucibacter sp. XJ19-41]MDC6166251.1 MFS transporter [Paucibacter sp. XJ19-41]
MGRFNLLASKKGRLWAFFLLYVSEGLPLGFATVAVVSQLRREGLEPAAIGAFIAALLIPWSLKWIGGPFVDAIRFRRFGHRRAWILGCQLAMVATLLALSQISFAGNLTIVTSIFFVHNIFAALQDVAIDGLAVNALPEEERGFANGLMYAGMVCGQALGGPGVLFLIGHGSFSNGFLLVAGTVLAIATFVVLPMREQPAAEVTGGPTPAVGMRGSLAAMRDFSLHAYKALTGSQGAFACLLFCLLPAGALSLNLSLKSTLAVELGFSPTELAQLSLAGSIAAVCGTLVGGFLSHRVGKKRLIAFSTLAACIPTLWLMWQLQMHGHIMPAMGKQVAGPALAQALWIALVAYQFLACLMIGARFAVFMDVTNPGVAATQFTIYAALNNLGLAMSASWQGKVAQAWGYPTLLAVDVAIGLLGLLVLPFVLKPSAAVMTHGDGRESLRTRALAWTLGAACLAWIPIGHIFESSPAVRGAFATPFTLVFVAASVFLLVRSAQGERSPWNLLLRGTAGLLLLMHAQPYLAAWVSALSIDSARLMTAHGVLNAISVLGGVVLLAAGTRLSRPGHASAAA